jgi:hypothetical protein
MVIKGLKHYEKAELGFGKIAFIFLFMFLNLILIPFSDFTYLKYIFIINLTLVILLYFWIFGKIFHPVFISLELFPISRWSYNSLVF